MPPQWKACWHASLPEIQWLTHVVLKEPRVPECASLHIMICGGRVRDPIQKNSMIPKSATQRPDPSAIWCSHIHLNAFFFSVDLHLLCGSQVRRS